MGKISKVEYRELRDEEYTKEDMAEYFYLYNILGVDSSIINEIENYNYKQFSMRDKVLRDIKSRNKDIIPKNYILALSSLKNKPVLLVNVR
jgi:hypothetical protein